MLKHSQCGATRIAVVLAAGFASLTIAQSAAAQTPQFPNPCAQAGVTNGKVMYEKTFLTDSGRPGGEQQICIDRSKTKIRIRVMLGFINGKARGCRFFQDVWFNSKPEPRTWHDDAIERRCTKLGAGKYAMWHSMTYTLKSGVKTVWFVLDSSLHVRSKARSGYDVWKFPGRFDAPPYLIEVRLS